MRHAHWRGVPRSDDAIWGRLERQGLISWGSRRAGEKDKGQLEDEELGMPSQGWGVVGVLSQELVPS